MMKQILLLALFAVIAIQAAEVEVEQENFLEAAAQCHPQCKWQCDDPSCPAVCHPVCERPKCQIQCEETECAKCTVHCDKPQCNVRCPKDLCEKESCPKCETVCSPANCRTSCVAPEPKCTPMCEATKCDWKCKKPITCPKPKCELVCDRPSCESRSSADGQRLSSARNGRKGGCCKCNEANVAQSIASASASTSFLEEQLPSFMEVMHSIKFQAAQGAEACCQCADQ